MNEFYLVVPDGNQYKVYRKDESGNPKGRALGTHGDEAAATKQIEGMTAVLNGDKDYPYYDSYHRRLEPDDPRANYDPLGGRAGERACANCFWFNASRASCDLIWGEIVATGVSDMWLAKKAEVVAPAVNPVPVYMVDPVTGEAKGVKEIAPGVVNVSGINKKQFEQAQKAGLFDKVLAALGMKTIPETPAADLPVEGFKIYPDGRWVGWWTNNAKDKAGEWFSAKAIDAYIERVDTGLVPYPELWYKHIPTLRMGKADHLARIGYLTFATGKFYDTPIGQAGKAHLEAEQKAGKVKTMSHGYLYPRNMKRGGVYDAFNSFELTVLDPGEECNPYTEFEVKTMFAQLDEKGIKRIEDIFGVEQAKRLIDFGNTESRKIEEQGVDLKMFNSYANQPITDEKAQAGLKAIAEATIAGFKQMDDRLTAIAESVKAADKQGGEAMQAVTSLKAFVDQQFGMTPRASRSALQEAAANKAQVDQLVAANTEAGTKTEPTAPENDGMLSVFDMINGAAKIGAI